MHRAQPELGRVPMTALPLILLFGIVSGITGRVAADDMPTNDADTSREKVESLVSELENALKSLAADAGRQTLAGLASRDLFPDLEIYLKGAKWALRYDTEGRPTDPALIEKAVARGASRVRAMTPPGAPPWTTKRGRVVRGYISSVDGSVQPYGLVVPKGYDPAKPIRLDVVLHGSTRPQGASELKFMERFDDGDNDSQDLVDQPFIELHPLGRVENCYRWAGETDVFEAIEDVRRKYNIDRDRIVLRGMSMGASGTWHLGLKHPDRFVALGPYCGYVDTHRFSETPLDNFVRVGPLPEHQELSLHMLDSVDYAANAGVVPAIACMGEKDVFFHAHVIMGEAMQREGLTMVNLISPGTGHVIDPVTHAEQMRRIGEHSSKGVDRVPHRLRFVTWTLKYPRCHWLELRGLGEHYQRSEIAARILEDGIVEIDEPTNVARFAVLPEALRDNGAKVRVAGVEFAIETNREEGKPRRPALFARRAGSWALVSLPETEKTTGKRPGLTGPIDDAFTTKFLCVRGTGRPWNPRAHAYAAASLQRFAYEWHRYFRGELPVKDDKDVTRDDVRDCNLILFGDPGSNSWIAQILPDLPIHWTTHELVIAGATYPAAEHIPALIHPNPLAANADADRYVVLNSGHTFHEDELNKLNYLLFPRWGDWAVLKVGDRIPENASVSLDETVLRAGFFNEAWQFIRDQK